MAHSLYFKRLRRECRKISPHIRFKRIKYGFYRLYYKNSYLHEVDENLPYRGYDFEIYNPRLENKSYYEEYEDTMDVIRTVKNYKEGYSDAMERIMTRMWMHRHSQEFNEKAENAYRQVVVK